MKISILAFGIAKDIVGQRFMDWELDEKSQLGQLRASLESKFPALLSLAAYRLAVNSEYAETDDIVLNENDEVAIIPPVAGG